MGVQFSFWDGGDEFVIWREHEVSDFLDVGCDGGGEEHPLTIRGSLVRKAFDNVFQRIHEPHIQ